MIKKLIAFAIGAGISLSASAGYVQYQLSGVQFEDGGIASGVFVQDSESRAILFYQLMTGGASFGNQYFVSGSYANLLSVSTNFSSPGPTSFQSYVTLNDSARATLNLDFSWNALTSTYAVHGGETSPQFDFMGNISQWNFRNITAGSLVEGPIDPQLQAALDAGVDFGIKKLIPVIPQAPADVPEPGSLALLAAGICGLAGLRRRRSAHA
jgi:hypothetical protein